MFPRLILATGLLLALPALAGTPINETRPLASDGRVSVDNLKGEIIVRTWDRPEVRITGTLGEGVEKLLVEGGGDSLSIQVKYPRGGGGWFSRANTSEPSQIEVTLPATAALDVDAVSARVDISGLRGGRLTVDSVSGEVRVRDSRLASVRIDSVSGDVDAGLESADISVDTVSGDIRLDGGAGDKLSVETVSGDASLRMGELQRVRMETVSGDLELAARLARGGSIVADSVSGSVRLRLPADTSASLAIETFSGGISSPVGQVQTERHGPGKRLQSRLGDGAGEVRVDAFSGDVRIELINK